MGHFRARSADVGGRRKRWRQIWLTKIEVAQTKVAKYTDNELSYSRYIVTVNIDCVSIWNGRDIHPDFLLPGGNIAASGQTDRG